jgi:hypothetical protein
MLEFIPVYLRPYLGHDHAVCTGSTAAPYRNKITDATFATEQEALLSIHAALKTAGAKYGDRLDEVRSLYQAVQ